MTVHARAVSYGQLIFSFTFNRCSVKIALCHSYIPLHHGDSAGVVDIFILKFLQKSVIFFQNFFLYSSKGIFLSTISVLVKQSVLTIFAEIIA